MRRAGHFWRADWILPVAGVVLAAAAGVPGCGVDSRDVTLSDAGGAGGTRTGVSLMDAGTERVQPSEPDAATAGSADAGSSAETPCEADRTRVSGVCLPVPAPRLVAPLSTSRVTSRRPTLRWELAANSDGAHVELCRDRACETPLAAFDIDGDRGVPPLDLPPGVVFWRAYGREGLATGLNPSFTWQFTVGARTAPIDSSWGTAPDFNGDGYAEVVFSGHLYLGNATGIPSSPVTILNPNPSNTYFADLMASAGDINGDGYADLIVDAGYTPAGGTPQSFVYVYLGGSDGIFTYPAQTLDVSTEIVSPTTLAGVGDTNGDGYADIVVSDSGNGHARLYFGGPSGLSSMLSTQLNALDGTARSFGRSVVGAGDVNGDGFADILATNGGAAAEAYLYLGSATAPGGSSITLQGPTTSNIEFGRSASGVDDMNGDGYADVIIGEDFQNHAYIYFGGAAGPAPAASVDLLSPDSGTALFGFGVSGLGDTNGDGFADAVVGTDQTGRVYVYLGAANGIGPAPSVTPTRPSDNPYFGFPVSGVGDVDGDGFEDLLVAGDGKSFLFRGSALGVSASVDTTLTTPPP
jgi:hypothetical protein